jgi:hypothetical protein
MKNVRSFVLSLAVGVPLTLLILIAIVGDFSTAMIIFGASIICTAGISLIIWLPVCYGIGFSALWLAGQVVKLFHTPEDSSRRPQPTEHRETVNLQVLNQRIQQSSQQHNQQALEEYIQRAIAYGYTEQKIIENLTQHGWSESEIQQAYAATLQIN